MNAPVPASLLDDAAARFRLLGDPVRLRLLNELLERGEATVQDLAAATGHSHQNTSKHLRLLAEGGIVGARRDGVFSVYRVTDPSVPGLCLLVCGQLRAPGAEARMS
jgi:DNA-binding transcriptional ArsR family regulator